MEIHSLLLPDGSVLSSGQGVLPAIKQVCLTQKVNTAAQLCFGSVFASVLEADILCPEGQLPMKAGDRVELYRGEAKQGVFYVEKPTKTGKGVYKLTAYDALRCLDKDLSLWLSGLPDWPYTLQDFARMVCDQCGVEMTNEDIPNGDFPVEAFSGQEITGRMLLSWACQVSGRFCRATPDGQVEFAWYTPTDAVLTPSGEGYYYRGSFSREDYAVKPIDQVVIRSDSTDVGTVYPQDLAGENVYALEGNPLLSAKNGQSLQGIAQSLYGVLSGISYTPCQVSVPANLDIRPGQIVTVEDGAGSLHTMYVMERRRNGGKDTLSCTGGYQRETCAVANRTSLTALSGKVLHLRMDVDGLFAENKDTAGSLSQMELDLSGIRTQVIRGQEETAGVKTQLSKLEQDSGKLDLRISQIEELGAGKVTTETGYRFDGSGLWISKSGEEMENKLDNTGMYVRRSGNIILQANNQGVEATDVAVRNYLMIGDFARLEDYSSGTDAQRTACFFVGG